MTTAEFALASVVVFLGFAVRGLTGFGAAMAIVPILALWLPLRHVVALVAVLSVLNGIWLTARAWRHVAWRESIGLLVGGLPGVVIGVAMLQRWRPQMLHALLGVVVIVLGIWLSRGAALKERRRWSGLAAPGAGLAAGLLGGAFGTSGPPLALYLAGRGIEHGTMRATILFFFLTNDSLRLLFYWGHGDLNRRLGIAGLAMLPASVLGALAGTALLRRVDDRLYRRILGVVLGCLGILLISRAWF